MDELQLERQQMQTELSRLADVCRNESVRVLHFMLFDCPVNSITCLTAMHRSQPLFQHIVQLIQIKRFGDMLVHAGVLLPAASSSAKAFAVMAMMGTFAPAAGKRTD